MGSEYENYGFYKVDINYVKHLNSQDSQVFYSRGENYERKPYLGLITKLGDYTYCIPLTSGKARHLNWSNITEHNYIIHEIVKENELHEGDVYKKMGQTDNYKKILSVLEIRKMIPVKEGLYKYIEFSKVDDNSYKDLLEKEYNFIKRYKSDILSKAETLYQKQISTGIIKNCYCNFKKLEEVCKNYQISTNSTEKCNDNTKKPE